MRTILTPDVLKTMSCDEFEDWRDSGEDFRRELTHAVMRDLSCPENWDVNGEYRSEFGGFFPYRYALPPRTAITILRCAVLVPSVRRGWWCSCPPAVARSPSFVP